MIGLEMVIQCQRGAVQCRAAPRATAGAATWNANASIWIAPWLGVCFTGAECSRTLALAQSI